MFLYVVVQVEQGLTEYLKICGYIYKNYFLTFDNLFQEHYKGSRCQISPKDQDRRQAFYIYIFTAIFLTPSCLMGFAYIRTSITLWRSVQKQQAMKKWVLHVLQILIMDACIPTYPLLYLDDLVGFKYFTKQLFCRNLESNSVGIKHYKSRRLDFTGLGLISYL